MHHLIALIIRTIEGVVNVLWKTMDEGDLKLTAKEVKAFKKIGGVMGAAALGSP